MFHIYHPGLKMKNVTEGIARRGVGLGGALDTKTVKLNVLNTDKGGQRNVCCSSQVCFTADARRVFILWFTIPTVRGSRSIFDVCPPPLPPCSYLFLFVCGEADYQRTQWSACF